MCRVELHTANLNLELHTSTNPDNRGTDFAGRVQPSADFIDCLLTGAMAALPAFLTAFTACLKTDNDGQPTAYTPGHRQRCSDS